MDFFAHFAVLSGGKSGRFLVGPIKSIRGARAVCVETDTDAHGFFIGVLCNLANGDRGEEDGGGKSDARS